MNTAYVSAVAALAGSGIGALASFSTTWLTQHAEVRAQRFAKATARRELLIGEFIEEASKLLTDALTHEFDDPSKLVRLYALVGKLPLFAPADVISQAEEAMRHIVETYNLPNVDFHHPENRQKQRVDVLRPFSEACREDLRV